MLLAVLGFGVVVLGSAARDGGGSRGAGGLLARMGRSPEERAELNRWAFYAHRLTGFAVFAFLVQHIAGLAAYAISPALYDDLHELYGMGLMRLFECGLLFAILFHTFNGLRLLVVDLADLRLEDSLRGLRVAVLLTLVLGLAGSAVILAPVLG